MTTSQKTDCNYVIHETHFPILYIQIKGTFTIQEMERALARLRVLVEEGTPFGMIWDGRTKNLPDAKMREVSARFLHDTRNIEKVLKAYGVVLDNAIARGAFTAFNWIAPNRIPNKAFATTLEAEAFVWKHLEPEREKLVAASYGAKEASR